MTRHCKYCKRPFLVKSHPWGGRPQLFCKPRCRDIYYNRERRELETRDAQRSRAETD